MPKNLVAAGRDDAPFSASEARHLGAEAFVFGFPLLMMAAAMRHATDVRKPTDGRAPLNQFAHLNRFPDPTLTAIVAANADTLYSLAWLDLSAEPILLELPDTSGRSYMLPLVDAWTNIITCLGPRTTGDHSGVYALTGPNWDGPLPAGSHRINAPTNTVWAVSHIHALDGDEEVDSGRALQQALTLTPLSSFGDSCAPPDRTVDAGLEPGRRPIRLLTRMLAEEFLGNLAAEMGGNPPGPRDRPFLDRLAAIGLRPGEPFDWTGLPDEVQESLEAGLTDGRAVVAELPPQHSKNGWEMHGEGLGSYGTNYQRRAQIANVALGAAPREDASFPATTTDSEGRSTNGSHRYQLRFEADELPPVGALWSLVLYDMDQLVVANPIDRYALGDRDEMELGADGSLEIVVQHERPGGTHANWLPAPEDNFSLMLHLYWPGESVLDGTWVAPPIQRIA